MTITVKIRRAPAFGWTAVMRSWASMACAKLWSRFDPDSVLSSLTLVRAREPDAGAVNSPERPDITAGQ